MQEGVGRGESRGDEEEHFGTMGGEYAQFYGSTCCERARNQVSKHAAVGAGAKGGGGAGVGVGGPGGAMGRALRRIDVGDRQDVMRALAGGEPFILTGLDVGPCVGRWSAQYLHAAARDKQLAAGVHVCPYDRSLLPQYWLSFDIEHTAGVHVCPYDRTVDLAGHRRAGTRKNFHFVEMPFGEFIQRCAPLELAHLPPLAPVVAAGERLYLRSVATGAEAARILKSALCSDLTW